MKLLDKKTAGDAVKLLIFIVVTTLATGLLVITIGNISFASSKEYKAVFSDATGVVKGDDVRVAGVKVGNVKNIDVYNRTRALVTFKVDDDPGVTDSTNATDPLPQPGRPALHLAEPGRRRSRHGVAEGDTIPLSRTQPALDLTVLFNGFKPLFQALSPADVNKLSYEIVTVFQGEGGTLESLLSHTASVTSTLASRDQVIGSLINNLNEVMVTIGNRDKELSDLLIKLRQFVSGLVRGPEGDPRVAGLDLRAGRADLRPGHRHPAAADHRRQAAAQGRRQPRQQQAGDRPGAAGAADQAHQGRPHGDLRLVLQLLPVQLQGQRQAARRLARSRRSRWTTRPTSARCDLG